MNTVWLVVAIVVLVGLCLVVSLSIPRSQYSEFELIRRRNMGDAQAIFGLKRQKALGGLLALQVLVGWLLLAFEAILLVVLLGWLGGILASVVVVGGVGSIARLGIVRRGSQKLYRKYENSLISFVGKYKKLFRILSPPLEVVQASDLPGSREELEHVLQASRSLVTPDEAAVMTRSLKFFGRTIADVMTPISSVVTVEAGELLGPLVLDDLHRTGHTLFPVENGSEVVGLLDITDSVGLRSQESPSVRDIMRHEMVRVAHDEPLDEALRILIDSKQPCLLVTGEDQAVVGLISLGDVVRALTGWTRRH